VSVAPGRTTDARPRALAGVLRARLRLGGLRGAVAGSVAAKAVELATLVALATVVPRTLGPSDYGRYSVLLTVVTLGSLALTLGGPTLMARFVPAAPVAERVGLARAIGARLARGRAVQLAVLAVTAAVLIVADADHFPPAQTAMVFVALALNVATSLALQVALGLGRTGPWATRFPLQNTVLIVATLVLYPIAGVDGATVAILVSAAVGAGYAAFVVRPLLSGAEPRVAVPAGAVRFGALQAAAAALVQFAQRGGVLAVALLAGSTRQTGFAALAIGIALGVTYAVLQTFTVALPHVADEDAVDTRTGEARLRRLAELAVAVAVPATLVVAAFLDVLVPACFGEQYRGATSAFGPALAMVVLAPIAALAVQVSALRLRPDVALVAAVVTAGTFVVVSLLAVPAFGAVGGTGAALAGCAAGAGTAVARLRGSASVRLTAASFAGAAAVCVVALVS
jgi:O-antigen/teichoic acid export membrane protein